MPEYLSAIGREFDTVASRWFGVIEGGVTLAGYGATAWLWWNGAEAWQTAVVGALSTCVLVLIIYSAGRAAWTSEHRKRIEVETAWKGTMRSHALGVEWDKAIAIFRGLPPEQIQATYTESSDGQRRWSLWGSSEAHIRACDVACRIAAHALSVSKVGTTLPSEILSGKDGLAQWLRFVVHKDGWNGFTGEGIDNTVTPPITSKSNGIRDVALSSKRLCEFCRDSETYLQ